MLNPNISRRVLIGGGASSLALLAIAPKARADSTSKPREYTLEIKREFVNITGRRLSKITVNGTIPGPVLHFTEGEEAIIHVVNKMSKDTSVHWHGLLLPGPMDGAPGFNGFEGIKPNQSFTYRFKIRQAGTYWYHAHSMGQEQDGLYGAIIIAPKEPDGIIVDRDYAVLLSDFSPERSEDIMSHLKMSSEYYQYNRRTLSDFVRDARQNGLSKAAKNSRDWGKMRMLRTDLSDVTGYHFLFNGKTNRANWTGLFNLGEEVRLRFINAGAMTMFDIRIPDLKMTLVAADGQMVEPIEIDEFRFGNAETYDFIVEPLEAKAYTIVCESIDRNGFALGTLAPREGMKGEAPKHRPRAELTMADMNMEMMMRDDPNMDMSHIPPSGWAQMFAPEGAKILAYSDIIAKYPQPDTREPSRDIEIRLGGNMERYIWTLNGKKFNPHDGIDCAYNERVRLNYINETMMAHPVHLHGMFVQYDNGQPPEKMPNKHTFIVPPGGSTSVILTANEIGEWPLHCHLFYHMNSGMMTTLRVKAGDAVNAPSMSPEPNPPTKKDDSHAHH